VFIVGLIIGPALGLLVGDVVIGARAINAWATFIGLIVLCLIVLAVPVFDPGLRIGLAGGVLLGVLVSRTQVVAEGSGFRV
jgi:hypothetical protein